MLVRIDPFGELDRRAQQAFLTGTWSRPAVMPMDAYREGDTFVVAFDLPGVDPGAIEVDVERNTLSVKAERRPLLTGDDVEMHLSERPLGVFARRLVLGEDLDPDGVTATYDAGVLTLRIPITEKARPRRIPVAAPPERTQLDT
ncbi:Hsp20/alpha crystallin family protein [Pseudonocardia thermophila]|jgi:Molecular chaperone (small heat shock protein)|uniref:Hsp20/alpha crystallin family protein n=1 Tax=Pseudonocardia thermophila TaxID=1848 RepID=UPI00248E4DE1|nr:Hsp20/alpha crystallin family protein [Pseudonocardia thermophila]